MIDVEVEHTTLATGSIAEVKVKCPLDYLSISGGYRMSGTVNGFLPVVYNNSPAGSGAWLIRAHNPRFGLPIEIYGFNVCVLKSALK